MHTNSNLGETSCGKKEEKLAASGGVTLQKRSTPSERPSKSLQGKNILGIKRRYQNGPGGVHEGGKVTEDITLLYMIISRNAQQNIKEEEKKKKKKKKKAQKEHAAVSKPEKDDSSMDRGTYVLQLSGGE